MSEIKISQLDQAGALTGAELIPLVQDNLTSRTTLQQIKAFAGVAISNNIIADAASTTIAPSVNAIKTYTDGLVSGLLNDRGNYTPSVTSPGDYPSSGGSGVGGAIEKGDIWFIDGVGYLGTTAVAIGSSVRALVNNPSSTTDSDWDILDAALIQATLQNVLNAGNSANNTITLTDGTISSTLSKDSLQLDTNILVNAANYNAYTFDIINNGGDYISGSTDRLKVYDITTDNSTELKYDSLNYNNYGFIGKLSTNVLTNNQLWSFPNASGTIALTSTVWSSLGNAGTVAGTNFLGTTDAVDFVAKTNNTERLRILSTGQVKLSSLVGSGTRMVVANATGQLSAQTITSPTLQTVTNAGNTTTNDIISSNAITSLISTQSSIDSAAAQLQAISGESGYLILSTLTGLTSTLSPVNLTGSRIHYLPDQDGTIALLSDINNNNSWLTTGNVGTTPGTDFIGTTDNKDLVFKTNNFEALRLDTNGYVLASWRMRVSSAGAGKASIDVDAITKGTLTLGNLTSDGVIDATLLTTDRSYQLPDVDGTIALTNTVTLQSVTSGTNKNLTNGINLQGTNAGVSQTGTNVNAFGTTAGYGNTGSGVNGFGHFATQANTGSNVNGLGNQAAQGNSGSNVNAIGNTACTDQSGSDVNAFGSGAASSNSGSDVNAFGYLAGQANTLSGMTIFSNSSMPSYANYAAASAAITVLLGATANCTYLYHDQATNSIGAVRL